MAIQAIKPSCGHPVGGGVCSCSSSPSTIPSLGVPTPREAASRQPGSPKSFAPSEAGIFPSSELADHPPPCRARRPHGARSSTERKLPCCPMTGQSRRPRSPACSAGLQSQQEPPDSRSGAWGGGAHRVRGSRTGQTDDMESQQQRTATGSRGCLALERMRGRGGGSRRDFFGGGVSAGTRTGWLAGP